MPLPCGQGVQLKFGDVVQQVNQNESDISSLNQNLTGRIVDLEGKDVKNTQDHNSFNRRLTDVENSGTNLGTLTKRVDQLEAKEQPILDQIDVERQRITDSNGRLDVIENTDLPKIRQDILSISQAGFGPSDVDPSFPVTTSNKLATLESVSDAISSVAGYSPLVVTMIDSRASNIVGSNKGGTSVKDAWTDRLFDGDPHILLKAGKYSVIAHVPATGGTHQARIIDGADTVIAYGTTSKSTDENSYSVIINEFFMTTDGSVKIQTMHDTDVPDVGLGVGSPFTGNDSVYTVAVFTKID